jgi:hypothetical protein
MTLGAISRRVILSGVIAIPAAWLAVAVTVHNISNWPRAAISPGSLIAFRLVEVEPCGGILGCLFAPAAVSQAANIALAVNAILYGFLVFGIATVISALRKATR